MSEEYAIVEIYNDDGPHHTKDSVSETLVNNTGEGTKVSTQEALGNLCQILADKGLLTSAEFGKVIGVSDYEIWFGKDSDCPF